MYHYIREVDKNKDLLGYNLSIAPSRFDSQLKYLKDNNYKTVTFLDLMSKPLPKNPIILTFDDGYKDFYTQAFPILQKYNFTGVLYIIPKFILNFPNRYVSMEEIKEISSYGIEIGNHTYTHADIRQLPSKSLLESIEKTQVFIKDLIGITPISFAYPAGKYTQKELDLIKETPIMFAVTTKSGVSDFADYYQLRRIRIDNRISLERFKKALDR
jgi:peptidoglycan/xylan/chitin deacetylase (PgdA/CDA1 family)